VAGFMPISDYDDSMKVAVLISGSMRTFDSAWPHNEKLLSSLGISYDIYLHTWNENFGTHHGVPKGLSPRRFFWRWYPTKFRAPENYNPADYISISLSPKISIEKMPDLVELIPELSLVKTRPDARAFMNSSAMYLGMEKVAQLALDSNTEYSHFLRIRSDFMLSKRFKFRATKDVVLCADGVLIEGKHISDQCFYAPFDLMDPLMFNFTFLKEKLKVEGWYSQKFKQNRKAEFLFFENLYHSNLIQQLQKVPKSSFGKILREIEVRDYEVSFRNHFKLLLIHNRVVLSKLVIIAAARVSRKLGLTNLLKSILRKS
jgi:hypothetical protein